MSFSVDVLCTGVPLLHLQAEKGRLNQDEIDRMVKEAEEFADQDKAIKAKIDAKNSWRPTSTRLSLQLRTRPRTRWVLRQLQERL